ncbi:MAG: MFS transporter [Thermoanaerobaculia bacterium]|nr:MFS transporter [Thermoanaerobaculia bacterium]
MFDGVTREQWKSLLAAMTGWMLDSMDFLLFTFAIGAIQAEFGLPSRSMGMLMSVALFAGAAGGILFGRLADRFGRVRAMTWSILLYSVATGGLATSQGLAALVFWRVLVGLGMGGEWACGSVLVAETWPAKHRAKAIGLMQSGWAIGALAAAGLTALILERYGWRALFVAGLLPSLAAFLIRRHVKEPEMWTAQEQRGEARPRFSELFSPTFVRRTLIASLLASSVLVAYWGLMTWLPSFLATPIDKGGAGLTVTKSALWTVLIQLGAFAGYVSFGWIADRIGRRPAFTLFMAGALVTIPVYAAAASNVTVLLLVGPLVGYFAHGYFAVFGALLAELYPTSIRATGQGFCYNIGRLASALSPYFIGKAAETGGLGVALGVDALFFGLAAWLVWMLPETRMLDLEHAEPAKAS